MDTSKSLSLSVVETILSEQLDEAKKEIIRLKSLINSQSKEGESDYEKLLETVKIALSYRDFGVLNEYLINAGHEKISQSKENEGKQAGVWKAFKQIQLLCLKPFEGMEEMQKDWRTVYKISTNAISELSTIQSGERGEVERLKGEIKFLESEIGRLGGLVYKPKVK